MKHFSSYAQDLSASVRRLIPTATSSNCVFHRSGGSKVSSSPAFAGTRASTQNNRSFSSLNDDTCTNISRVFQSSNKLSHSPSSHSSASGSVMVTASYSSELRAITTPPQTIHLNATEKSFTSDLSPGNLIPRDQLRYLKGKSPSKDQEMLIATAETATSTDDSLVVSSATVSIVFSGICKSLYL